MRHTSRSSVTSTAEAAKGTYPQGLSATRCSWTRKRYAEGWLDQAKTPPLEVWILEHARIEDVVAMTNRIDVVIVGAGQAGLAVSRELTQAGVAHVVLEKGQVGQTWRGRWDSFCLVTPNWTFQLPGHPYDGGDPDGFMPRDEVVAYLERYAAGFEAPVREGVEVTSLRPGPDGGFLLETSAGQIAARTVVLGTGAYQRPHRPAGAATLPADLLQIDVEEYLNPAELPPGPVLMVGSGQSGCQIAEELHQAGREVCLACGRAPWMPRRLGDRDLVWWALETGFLDAPLSSLPSPAARLGRQRASDGGRRRPRPPLADAAEAGRHPARPLPRRRRPPGPIRAGPRRQRRLGR